MSILIIAEKNKAAKAIAEALGPTTSIKKTKFVNVYHVPSKDIYVVPLRGHILEYKNTDKYQSWTKSNPRDIITDPQSIKKIPNNYANPYIAALKEYAKLSNQCIIGTDADIEGCNIGLFDALPFVKQANSRIAVSQLWLSSLQKKEIIEKFKHLIPPKYSWGETGEARAIIDAIIGFSATREITNIFRALLKKLGVMFTSIGRVQTSLLYLIYLREEQIKEFIPEPYFTIDAELNYNNKILKAQHQKNPFKKTDEQNAINIFNKIKDEKLAEIISNTSNQVKRKPPTPLNTSKALILLTKNLKISANLALSTMNSLYLNKIISYPRTDSDVYKPDFDHLQYLNKFTKHSQYGQYSSNLLKRNKVQPTKGKKDAGDHPPITPLESLESESNLFKNDIQRRVYNLLARHYLALFGDDATEARTILKITIKDEPFVSKFVALISEGFFEIAPFLKIKYDSEIEIVGDEIPVEKITFNSKETKPPPHYSDTSLLKLMEKNGLGTKSTRPVIIQILQTRNLIYRNENRQYGITDLGAFIIANLKEIWLPFLEPTFTKDIEMKLDDIKEEKKTMSEVIDLIKTRFLTLFDKLLANKKEFVSKSENFEVEKQDKNFPLTTSMCPYCQNHPMKLVTTFKKKRFLACSDDECIKKNKSYLSVPKRGRISILKTTCSICGFNIFKINTRKYNKPVSYFLCPNCWTDGLKKKIDGKGFCSNCEGFKIEKNQCVKK